MPPLAMIARQVTPEIKINRFSWERSLPAMLSPTGGDIRSDSGLLQQEKKTVHIELSLSFPGNEDIEVAVKQTNAFANRLRTSMKGYTIQVVQQVVNILPNETFSGRSGASSVEQGQSQRAAQISIDGDAP